MTQQARVSPKKSCLRILVSILLLLACLPPSTYAQDVPFLTGWWTDITNIATITQYEMDGNTLLLADGGGWYTSPRNRAVIKDFLDEANKHGIRVLISLVRETNTPSGIPPQEYIDTINAFKDHPALYGWYLGDEPEIYKNHDGDREDDWIITHDILASDPGYYRLAKENDPNHPVLISFNTIYEPYDSYWDKIDNFFDVVDLVGIHSYPFWSMHNEFGGGTAREQFDVWKYTYERSRAAGKDDFVATVQGFGNNTTYPYRDPTYRELRFQVFSAIALGIDKVLYWHDSWANSNTKNLVKQMIGQTQGIGAEMNDGTTYDPQIKVSEPQDKLIYRFGIHNHRGIVLAVNTSGRRDSASQPLTVTYTLPSSVTTDTIRVLYEDRTLPVEHLQFTDTMDEFDVRIYSFTVSSLQPPTQPNPTPPSNTADINQDGIDRPPKNWFDMPPIN